MTRPYKRGRNYYIDLRWRELPRIRLSTGTKLKARAQAMVNTLISLRDAGRFELLRRLAAHEVDFAQVHEAFLRGPEALAELETKPEAPVLGPLVDEWIDHLRSPAGVSPRTKRRYAPQTIRRYAVSWQGFYDVLPKGRESRVSEITPKFIQDYRNQRTRADGGHSRNVRKDGSRPKPATINRDLVALASFFRWCRKVKNLDVALPEDIREKEPDGLERWLSATEVRALEDACDAVWWTLFASLVHTGMRLGEATGLRWGDVRLRERRISLHEGYRRLKTQSSVREVPITPPLAEILTRHSMRVPSGPADLVFPEPLCNHGAARQAWRKACLRAGVHDRGDRPRPTATLRDLRHTYGVMAAQAGIPIVRLQKLMGHATPHMTMRYMKHAPEAYFDEDAARLAAAIAGEDAARDGRSKLAAAS